MIFTMAVMLGGFAHGKSASHYA